MDLAAYLNMENRKEQLRQQKRNTNLEVSPNLESHKSKFDALNFGKGHNAIDLAIQRYSIFCHQDIKTGHFDVTFLFKEKQLHAHSFVLWSASDVFETMLFGSWAKKEPIPITSHSYDDFKDFLTFFYLGKCSITMDNVMSLVDLAESYNVQLLKEKCDQYLTNVTPTAETVFKICETLKIYSLQNALDNLYEFISINAAALLKNQVFFNTTKDVVMDIVKMERLVIKEEELFVAVYKWAETQILPKNDETPFLIKAHLSPILPHIRFPVMDVEFLHSTVVPLGYLFSSFGELSQILCDANAFQKKALTRPISKYPCRLRKSFNIELTDSQRNVAHAYIPDKNFIETISINNRTYSTTNSYCYDPSSKECDWAINISKPTTETNALFDLNACKIYLIRNSQGRLAVKDFSLPQVPLHTSNWQVINRINNNRNNPAEYDVIARVYCDNQNFTIGNGCGCYLRVLSENPLSIHNQDGRDYN